MMCLNSKNIEGRNKVGRNWRQERSSSALPWRVLRFFVFVITSIHLFYFSWASGITPLCYFHLLPRHRHACIFFSIHFILFCAILLESLLCTHCIQRKIKRMWMMSFFFLYMYWVSHIIMDLSSIWYLALSIYHFLVGLFTTNFPPLSRFVRSR